MLTPEREAARWVEFLRFKDYGGTLSAVFEPENFVLPHIAGHFVSRFYNENFSIYDKTHKSLLTYLNKQLTITNVDEYTPPQADGGDKFYSDLFKTFYDNAAIEERKSDKRQTSRLPKKYRKYMTEFL